MTMSDPEPTTTREQIIAAASHVLSEQGYDATTLKAIARAAGLAPGLVHYHFGGKDQLLVEVLQQASQRYTESMAPLRAASPGAVSAAAAMAEPQRRSVEEPAWYRLRYELFALGLRNPAIQPGLQALLASGRDSIAASVRSVIGQEQAESDAIAALLLACFDGLALQYMADPAFDLAAAYAALARLLEQLIRPG
jgi:TetR/AcrR family transcriptional repressor of bet genes